MFDNFTFGAVSRTRHDEILASPTDISFATPLPSFPFSPEASYEDLSDIVQQFSRQSLTREERAREFASWAEITNSPLEVDSDEEMPSLQPSLSAPSTAHNIPTEENFSCRRMQRQFHTQLQLSTSHLRDINSLVEHMIYSNSQCRLQQRRPSSRATSHLPLPLSSPLAHELTVDPVDDGRWCENSLDIDEGFCEQVIDPTKNDDEMSLRRASAPSGIRKYGPLKWGRSADACIGGRMKVKSKPRMRKRSAPK